MSFSPSLSKAYQKQSAVSRQGQLITSSFSKIITLVHYTDGTMLTVPSEQKVATTLDLLVRLVCVKRWGNTSNKNSGVFYFSEITSVLVVWGMLR